MRELLHPLIPPELYQECITHHDNLQNCLSIIEKCPKLERMCCKYMIYVLQIFSKAEYSKSTKMSVNNVSMVFGPNFLRCPSDLPQVIFENTKYEQGFLKTLIIGSKYAEDPEMDGVFGEIFSKY
eukprot:NODE_1027_length_2547_cov_0.477941.p3 type:complete len:125 gc:universal NODE_1027_length_2547_cov_0.477941:93-467(+)